MWTTYDDDDVREEVAHKFQERGDREERLVCTFYAGEMWDNLSPMLRQHARDVYRRRDIGNPRGSVHVRHGEGRAAYGELREAADEG